MSFVDLKYIGLTPSLACIYVLCVCVILGKHVASISPELSFVWAEAYLHFVHGLHRELTEPSIPVH